MRNMFPCLGVLCFAASYLYLSLFGFRASVSYLLVYELAPAGAASASLFCIPFSAITIFGQEGYSGSKVFAA